MTKTCCRILPGLPPYGPLAVPFSATGCGKHREGLVVEFVDDKGNVWVGNFQPGLGPCNAIFETFGKDRPIIVAGGSAYVVDVPSRKVIQEFGCTIEWCFELPERGWFVVADGFDFEARDSKGLVWRSSRISWDGMRDLIHRDDSVSGYAYSPSDDDYKFFFLDLRTGAFTGGSYNEP